MKATFVAACVCLLILGAALSAQAQSEKPTLGLGYHGILAGDVLQGLSGRIWTSPKVGLEANLYYAHVGVDVKMEGGEGQEDDEYDISGTLTDFSGKFLYAVANHSQSKFYVGAELGYGHVSVEVETPGLPAALAEGFDVITLGPLMGAEFSFAGIPEMSVDWELGYRTNLVDIEVADYDISLSMGVLAASVGVHYYFGR
ncbi:MAG TPA: outer membrane beta-barrel protein [candidate division Zixibacteria bacterium]|nr:outer membrane beta-barrel protein [candidate division Zixibacteria bacterium]MDD4917938.1 outer membrane beta-barrel protein [candidate division Zixibacteria bacterium]MDM7972510.1 outer membrane beta-barrel protein [candidate division Zixibacteria bacterium]HOD65235.1 outer membrane beta-barrel protein [candidate division Zixibacteria bacterium]HPI32413.1 outer membrane beta-barrel protein [candidate division Zixibacteria bacterium]